jgi:hypothetical protein
MIFEAKTCCFLLSNTIYFVSKLKFLWLFAFYKNHYTHSFPDNPLFEVFYAIVFHHV